MSTQFCQFPLLTSSSGGDVLKFPTRADFPATASDGQLALALDTDFLYAFNLPSLTWIQIGGAENSPVTFSVYQSPQQTIPNNVQTKVTLNNKVFDVGGYWNTSTSSYVPLLAGFYYFSLQGNFVTNTGGTATLQFFIFKNGGIYASTPSFSIAANTPFFCPPIGTVIQMNGSTDHVEVYALVTGNGGAGLAINNLTDQTFFSGFLVSAAFAGNNPAVLNAVYVSTSEGSDLSGTGSQTLPFKTIAHASSYILGLGTASISNQFSILIDDGTYTETGLNIYPNINLVAMSRGAVTINNNAAIGLGGTWNGKTSATASFLMQGINIGSGTNLTLDSTGLGTYGGNMYFDGVKISDNASFICAQSNSLILNILNNCNFAYNTGNVVFNSVNNIYSRNGNALASNFGGAVNVTNPNNGSTIYAEGQSAQDGTWNITTTSGKTVNFAYQAGVPLLINNCGGAGIINLVLDPTTFNIPTGTIAGTNVTIYPTNQNLNAFYVNPQHGHDVFSDGSQQFPYKTIAKAISKATSLSPTTSNPISIYLGPGSYTESTLHLYPNVNLIGAGADQCFVTVSNGTVIFDSSYNNITAATTVKGIKFDAATALSLSLTGLGTASPTVLLMDLNITLASSIVEISTAMTMAMQRCVFGSTLTLNSLLSFQSLGQNKFNGIVVLADTGPCTVTLNHEVNLGALKSQVSSSSNINFKCVDSVPFASISVIDNSTGLNNLTLDSSCYVSPVLSGTQIANIHVTRLTQAETINVTHLPVNYNPDPIGDASVEAAIAGIDNALAGITGQEIAFTAYQSSLQTISPTSARVKVLFDAKTFDVGNYYNTATAQYTPKVAGTYCFFANITFAQPTFATAYARIEIFKNGTGSGVPLASSGWNVLPTSGPTNAPLVIPIAVCQMNGTTDYIEIYISLSGNSGNSMQMLAFSQWTYFGGFLCNQALSVGAGVLNSIYVSKNGSDTTGNGSPSDPFLTIQHAQAYVVANFSPSVTEQFNVVVDAGTYNETGLKVYPNINWISSGAVFISNSADIAFDSSWNGATASFRAQGITINTGTNLNLDSSLLVPVSSTLYFENFTVTDNATFKAIVGNIYFQGNCNISTGGATCTFDSVTVYSNNGNNFGISGTINVSTTSAASQLTLTGQGQQTGAWNLTATGNRLINFLAFAGNVLDINNLTYTAGNTIQFTLDYTTFAYPVGTITSGGTLSVSLSGNNDYKEVHVSSDGNDTWADGSSLAPFKTIGAAQSYIVSKHLGGAISISNQYNIVVHPGSYSETGLKIRPNINWIGAGKNSVIVSSTADITLDSSWEGTTSTTASFSMRNIDIGGSHTVKIDTTGRTTIGGSLSLQNVQIDNAPTFKQANGSHALSVTLQGNVTLDTVGAITTIDSIAFSAYGPFVISALGSITILSTIAATTVTLYGDNHSGPYNLQTVGANTITFNSFSGYSADVNIVASTAQITINRDDTTWIPGIGNFTNVSDNNISQNWRFQPNALTDGATVTWNVSEYPAANVTTAASRTIAMAGLTASTVGQIYILYLTSGGFNHTWNSNFIFPNGQPDTTRSAAYTMMFVQISSTQLQLMNSFPGWLDVSGTSVTMVAGNVYYANNASLVTLTLPSTLAQNDSFEVIGKGSGGWKIAQASGQTIHWTSSIATTTGVSGSLASNDQYGVIRLRAISTTDLIIEFVKGNITVT